MFFPSRAFVQQQNPQTSYSTRYRPHVTPGYSTAYDGLPTSSIYSRTNNNMNNYSNFSYKPGASVYFRNIENQPPNIPTYSGALLFRASGYVNNEQSTSRYYGQERPTSKYFQSAIYGTDTTRYYQAANFQYRSRYDRYDDSNLESRYGIKITNERSYVHQQPSNINMNQTLFYQNAAQNVQQNTPSYIVDTIKSERKSKRSKSVPRNTSYTKDFFINDNPRAPSRNCEYTNNDQTVDFSVIAQKYGSFHRKKEQSNFQRKYPLILTNNEPMFDDIASSHDDYNSASESDSNLSSSPEIKPRGQRGKNQQKPTPFDPNRQLFSQAQNDVFQQYADQRINEIRMSRGQPPLPTSQSEVNHYLPNFERKIPYENTVNPNGSNSLRNNASSTQKRQPEVRFAFKNERENAVSFAPEVQEELIRRSSNQNQQRSYDFRQQNDRFQNDRYQQQDSFQSKDKYNNNNNNFNQDKYQQRDNDRYQPQQDRYQQRDNDRYQQTPDNYQQRENDRYQPSQDRYQGSNDRFKDYQQSKSSFQPQQQYSNAQPASNLKKQQVSDSDDKEDSNDFTTRLAKFRKTIEESKKSQRQFGQVLEKHEQRTQFNDDNGLLSETDSGKPQNEFLSEPSLVFESN